MKYLRQFAIILGICFIGEAMNRLLNIPVPGNVMGMIILLAALLGKLIKLESIEDAAEFMLKHLAFFFIPSGVGLISNMGDIAANLLPMLAVIILSAVVVMVTTGITIQFLKRQKS
jgi:holin-like protein